MFKLKLMLAAAVGGLGFVAVPAQAQNIAYTIYFYSDASHTTQVGKALPQCVNGNITYTVQGSTSSYQEQIAAYICGPDGPEPLE